VADRRIVDGDLRAGIALNARHRIASKHRPVDDDVIAGRQTTLISCRHRTSQTYGEQSFSAYGPKNPEQCRGAVALLSTLGSKSKMPVLAQKRRSSRMTFLARCRRGLQRISPYLSLLVLLVPLLLVEPLKLAALLVAGSGHWLAAAAILVAAYAASLLVIERLFRVLKPKIMMMGSTGCGRASSPYGQG
jgi:uncharacterized membrane protein (GlpM family)